MKNVLFLILLVFSLAAKAQSSVTFINKSYPEVLKQSEAQSKPVLLMFYVNWCSHCNKMKKEVLTDKAVADFYNASFLSSSVDMESNEGAIYREKFQIKSFPTFVYIDSKGELLYQISGGFNAADFLNEGKRALNPKRQFPYLKSEFLKDVSNSQNALNYIAALRKSKMNPSEYARKYLATQSAKQLISPINWQIISNGIHDIKSPEFQFVLKNQKEFAAVTSPIRVERKIINIVNETLKPLVEALDTLSYFKERSSALAIQLPKTDSIIFNYDLTLLEHTENWKLYQQITKESVSKVAWNTSSKLKEIARVYYANIIDIQALKDAELWTKRALTLIEGYDGYLVLAQIQLKLGDKTAALASAQKARAWALNYQWNTADSDAIIQQIN